MIEYAWLPRLQSATLYAYRFSADGFEPYGDKTNPHTSVARTPVRPLAPPEPVGDLLALHEGAGTELRVVRSLWPWTMVVGFSGIRLRDAGGHPSSGSAL